MSHKSSPGSRAARWVCAAAAVIVLVAAVGPAAEENGIEVYFSPKGGCEEAIINEIAKAKSRIDVQAYYFTSARLAEALVRARDRDVEIRVILDSGQRTAKYSSATFFFNQGIPVRIDDQHSSAHDKIMIIDDVTIITGSYNFTKSAEERNSENLLILRDKRTLALAYRQHFNEHLAHSDRYTGPKKP